MNSPLTWRPRAWVLLVWLGPSLFLAGYLGCLYRPANEPLTTPRASTNAPDGWGASILTAPVAVITYPIGYWKGNSYFCYKDHNLIAVIVQRESRLWQTSVNFLESFEDRDSAIRYTEQVVDLRKGQLCPLYIPDWRAK